MGRYGRRELPCSKPSREPMLNTHLECDPVADPPTSDRGPTGRRALGNAFLREAAIVYSSAAGFAPPCRSDGTARESLP